jgi:hypothetical protein
MDEFQAADQAYRKATLQNKACRTLTYVGPATTRAASDNCLFKFVTGDVNES